MQLVASLAYTAVGGGVEAIVRMELYDDHVAHVVLAVYVALAAVEKGKSPEVTKRP